MKLKHIILLGIFTILSGSIYAQGRASENRKNKAVEEDNLKMFGSNDEDFEVTESPEKWNKESAVVLCRKYNHNYLRQGSKKIIHEESVRTRVKINDQGAVDAFSIFYYRSSTASKFGIKIIKSDGSESIVDLKDAVEVADSEVPDYYNTSYSTSYKKIAIPNLEKGDIVDYYYSSESLIYTAGNTAFTPLVYTLTTTYPILKQKFYFNVDRGFKMAFRTFNTDADLVEGNPGVDKRGKVRTYIRTYEFEDENREKNKDEYWKYSNREEPTIKMQISFVTKSMVEATSLLITEDEVVKEPFDLVDFQNRLPKVTGGITGSEATITYLKRQRGKITDPVELAQLAYYQLRYSFYYAIFYGYSSYAGDQMTGDQYFVRHTNFTNALSSILYKLKIKHQYVIAVNKKYGSFDDVLLKQELITGIKVEDEYFFYFSNFTTHDFIPSSVAGSDAIVFDYPTRGKAVVPYEEVVIPAKDYSENRIDKTITATISDDFSTVNIKLNNVFMGYMKSSYTGVAVYDIDYFVKDQIRYNPRYKPAKKKTSGNKARANEAKRSEAEAKKEKLKLKYDYLKDYHGEDYDVESFEDFNLISDGRFADSMNLIYDEEFIVNDLVNKAGRNYIFEVGKLIGEQFELEEEDMKRSSDIYLSYGKMYSHDITVVIPNGYSVSGVDNLNVNISNEMGEFTCVASVEGQNIKLLVTKKYKVMEAKKSDWPKFIEFIEEAYKFTQKKVVLKKK